MIAVKVNVDAAAAQAGIGALIAGLESRGQLHREMAQGVEELTIRHLLGLNDRSPHTSFYGRAARSTEVVASDAGATVSITHLSAPNISQRGNNRHAIISTAPAEFLFRFGATEQRR